MEVPQDNVLFYLLTFTHDYTQHLMHTTLFHPYKNPVDLKYFIPNLCEWASES